jgi:hypothetical protein
LPKGVCPRGIAHGDLPRGSIQGVVWLDCPVGLSGSYRGISEIGVMVCLARSVPGGSFPCLFFVRVNQVLVRLWARVIDAGPLGWHGFRRSAACLTGRAVLRDKRPSGRRRGFRGV